MNAESTFLLIIEVLGTIAFAISGIRLAAVKRFDWFGAYIVGFVTAIGGGTLRDVLLDVPVFWMQSWWYLAVTALSLAFVITFRRKAWVRERTLFTFDTIGLALFVIIGIQKSLATGYPMWVAIAMGVTTGAFGGVVRDILINEEPLLFRKDIYATACVAGGLVYALAYAAALSPILQQSACGATVILLRCMAQHYGWHLPLLTADINLFSPSSPSSPDDNDKN
ncbi:MAG: trimeric intracellular cation channel family protein [Bacteroides sp.]|nr:trimeric intracellular cation channel family protein [Bacteroidales bacterium]MBD5316775.1 trimeric intracellular cation channel family protein [Bacteroides sp.]MBD5378247.1 trimeric intracellular cation channel family protein [Bacteroides sp.]